LQNIITIISQSKLQNVKSLLVVVEHFVKEMHLH